MALDVIAAVFECEACNGSGTVTRTVGGGMLGGARVIGCYMQTDPCAKCFGTGEELTENHPLIKTLKREMSKARAVSKATTDQCR